jgi:hypothetical protein
MYLFATTALEQFVDNLSTTQQYLQNLISLPALKKSPVLFEKINDKYNELTNKNKQKTDEANISTGSATLKDKNSHSTHNPMINNNLIVFDTSQDDKRGDKMNVKMPEFNREKFNNIFYNFSSPNTPYGIPTNPTVNQFNNKPKQNLESPGMGFQNNIPNPSFYNSSTGDVLGMGGMYYPGMSKNIKDN